MAEEECAENDRDFNRRIRNITELTDFIHELREGEINFESPLNLNMTCMKEIHLSELEWNHYELPPKKVKLTNTGHTALVSAKWFQERPYLTGGPLIGNYVFSQLHFHWGTNDMEGSEHMVDGVQYPLEMHAVHFKSAYLTQETALYEKDGVAVVVYFFKLQSQENNAFQLLLDYFLEIQKSYVSCKVDNVPINHYLKPFANDYFIYWGNIKTAARSHLILWMISREPFGISPEQVEMFRSLLDENEEPLLRNFRSIETVKKNVFHVNPSASKYSTLLPIIQETTKLPISKRRATLSTKSKSSRTEM